MRAGGKSWRTIWPIPDPVRPEGVQVIDQRQLPHRFRIVTLGSPEDAAAAIRDMTVRGAPLIGVTAAYGIALAMRIDPDDRRLAAASALLAGTRPTAVNLQWALARMGRVLDDLAPDQRAEAAFREAGRIADDDVAVCAAIGREGATLLDQRWRAAGGDRPLQVLTHCNAGWLAAVDWGTALAPVYAAHRAGLPLHVWVDETRPRNQGASLTAWELGAEGVPHTVVVDNAGGHLMQRGRVDLCLVGTDRTARNGDVCNKIGTYLKALAASDTRVPFYVALPSSTIDWRVTDGLTQIPIEERSPDEVTQMTGAGIDGTVMTVRLTPEGSPAANPAFDVTPARLVTALITERGVCAASEAGLLSLFPEMSACTS